MISSLALLVLATSAAAAEPTAPPPRPVEAMPLRSSQRPLVSPPHIVSLGLGLGAQFLGPVGPARRVSPIGDLLLGWSFDEGKEWQLPLIFHFALPGSGATQHSVTVGIYGFGIGFSFGGVQQVVLSGLGAFHEKRILGPGAAWTWGGTLAISGQRGLVTSLTIIPSLSTALVFDLGDHFAVSPGVELYANVDPWPPPLGRVVTPGVFLSVPFTWHPNLQWDVTLRSGSGYIAGQLDFRESLFVGFRF